MSKQSTTCFRLNQVTGCLTISVDNSQVNSTIDTSVITYSIDGGAWLTYSTPLCSLTNIDYSYKYDVDLSFTTGDTLCNPTGNFTFQATVTFDEDSPSHLINAATRLLFATELEALMRNRYQSLQDDYQPYDYFKEHSYPSPGEAIKPGGTD